MAAGTECTPWEVRAGGWGFASAPVPLSPRAAEPPYPPACISRASTRCPRATDSAVFRLPISLLLAAHPSVSTIHAQPPDVSASLFRAARPACGSLPNLPFFSRTSLPHPLRFIFKPWFLHYLMPLKVIHNYAVKTNNPRTRRGPRIDVLPIKARALLVLPSYAAERIISLS
jgi:hypothetical protein